MSAALSALLQFAIPLILEFCNVRDISSLVCVSRSTSSGIKDHALLLRKPAETDIRVLFPERLLVDAALASAEKAAEAERKRLRQV